MNKFWLKTLWLSGLVLAAQVQAQRAAKASKVIALPKETLAQSEGLSSSVEPDTTDTAEISQAPEKAEVEAASTEKVVITTTSTLSTPVVETAPALQNTPNQNSSDANATAATHTTTQTAVALPAKKADASNEEKKSAANTANKSEEKFVTINPVPMTEVMVSEPWDSPNPRLALGAGYIDAHWNNFSPALKNGSFYTSISLAKEFIHSIESGLTFQNIRGTAQSANQDQVQAWHVALDTRYLMGSSRFRPFVSFSIAAGSYQVWTLNSETDTLVSYSKHGNGTLIGIIPGAGVRLQLTHHFSTDLVGGYNYYLKSPSYRVGGWNAGFNLGFSR